MGRLGKKIFCRRITALLLCCIVFCSAVACPAAAGEVAAASVAVNGAQLIIAGLTGQKAVDELAPKFSPVVGGVLDGCGVKTHAVGETTPSQFITTKVAQFCGAVGYSVEKFWVTIAKGCFIAENGAIQLSKEASGLISQFGSWLFTADGEVVPEIPSSPGDVAVAAGYTFSQLLLGTEYTNIYTNYWMDVVRFVAKNDNHDLFVLQCTDGIAFLSTSPISVRIDLLNNVGGDVVNTSSVDAPYPLVSGKNIYCSTIGPYTGFPFNTVSVDRSTVRNTIRDSATDIVINPGGESVPGQDVFIGTPETWAENKDLLNPGSASEQVTTLNPDLLNPIIEQLQAGHAYDIAITDYLDALAKAFDRVADATVAVRDRVTAIEDTISIPSTATEDLTVTLDVTPSIVTPAVDPEEINYDGSIEGVSYDLTRIFPFCIPFDVVAAVELFDAAPVTPHYEIHVMLPNDIPFDIVLDLSDFNTVASVCRKLELILFIVGLAAVTRSLFIRS